MYIKEWSTFPFQKILQQTLIFISYNANVEILLPTINAADEYFCRYFLINIQAELGDKHQEVETMQKKIVVF